MAEVGSDIPYLFALLIQSLSNATTAWYSIRHVNDNVPSLSSLLNTPERNILLVLQECGLGKYCANGKFIFYAKKFAFYTALHDLEKATEITSYKNPNRSNSAWFICIGSKDIKSIAAPFTTSIGPRIHFINSISKEFIHSIYQPEEEVIVSDKEENNQTVQEELDETSKHLMVRLKQQLLPLMQSSLHTRTVEFCPNVSTSKYFS